MMDVRPLRTEADYDWALIEISQYFETEPALGSAAADRFDVLSALIASYEAAAWPIGLPDPVAAIREVMTAQGRTQSDLARVLGSRSRASEILARKRPLTLSMAYELHRCWHIPAELLITPYHAEAA